MSEWTMEIANKIAGDIWNRGGIIELLVDAHNAALAAATARELHSYDVAKQCRDELAAEREKFRVEHEVQLSWRRQVGKLREQIAAEREKWQLAIEECHRIISKKNEQLAAEQERARSLVDALERAAVAIRSEDHARMGLALVVICDRLVQVKEGQ